MPDMIQWLKEASAAFGPSGQEKEIAEWTADQFRPFVDEVEIDQMYNVIAHKKGTGPKVMICAHLDEIAMIVNRIEDDGSLRLKAVGGIDTRILPASRVWVHTKQGRIFGTIGAIPPHLASPEDRKKNYSFDNLHVDIGFSGEKAREIVRVGDIVTFQSRPTELMNHQFSSKTMDDRCCVVMMLRAAERLQRMMSEADIWFVASSQEEVGLRGATAAAFAVDPDLAIVMDVDFAATPGSKTDTTIPADRMSFAIGPYAQQKLTRRMMDCADAHHVSYSKAAYQRGTGTDADIIGITRAGVPLIVYSMPQKYMHTSVESIDTRTLEEGARLLAHFLSELDSSWEDDLWI